MEAEIQRLTKLKSVEDEDKKEARKQGMMDVSDHSMSLADLIAEMQSERDQKASDKKLLKKMEEEDESSSDDDGAAKADDMSDSDNQSASTVDAAAEREKSVRKSFLFAIFSCLAMLGLSKVLGKLFSCFSKGGETEDVGAELAQEAANEVADEATAATTRMLLMQQSSQNSSSSLLAGPMPVHTGGADQA